MRAAVCLRGLLRAGTGSLGSTLANVEPCPSSRIVSRIVLGASNALCEQRPCFSTSRVGDDDKEEGLAPIKEARRPNLKTKPKIKSAPREASPEKEAPKPLSERARLERKEKISTLLKSQGLQGSPEAAKAFVENFFAEDVYQGESAATSSADSAGAATVSGAESLEDEEAGALTLAAPDEMTEEEEELVLSGLQGLKRGSRRIVLQQLLQGKILDNDPEARREWAAIEASLAPPSGFRMRVVDVNRTSKGTQAGGLYRFGAMVVVGNGEGVLGWGQGKAAELQAAVKKAYVRACSNLFPIPRYNGHTVPERAEAKFGQVKLVVYPKAAGTGIVASEMMAGICKMAGIHDIGIKIHGSRNRRNAVKCLFDAFGKMRTHEEILSSCPDTVVLARPPGRFAQPRPSRST